MKMTATPLTLRSDLIREFRDSPVLGGRPGRRDGLTVHDRLPEKPKTPCLTVEHTGIGEEGGASLAVTLYAGTPTGRHTQRQIDRFLPPLIEVLYNHPRCILRAGEAFEGELTGYRVEIEDTRGLW